MAVPKLRFKADDGSYYPDLVEIKIGDAIKEAKRPLDMKDDEKYQLVTVKRRNEGIISRGMFYGRDILVKNYYTVKKGDYIISKRQVIHGANGIVPPELDDAIVSNEYMVLSDSSTLLVNYLALYSMTKKMYHMFYISSYGVDIEKMFFNVDDWKKKKIMVPCIKEQQKIVELFSLIDTVIEKQKETVSAWEERKKGVMQKLFGQEVRFKADDESDFPDWEEKKLGDVFTERTERSKGGESLLSVTIAQGIIKQSETDKRNIASENKSNYKIVKKNDLAYNTMRMWQGAEGVSEYDGIVSPAYTVITAVDGNNSYFFETMFKQTFMLQVFQRFSQGLTSDTWNLKFPAFSEIKCQVPCEDEQNKIVECVAVLDDVIEKQKETLAAWEELKKGLLQQMFV